jgi:hypothetical protein
MIALLPIACDKEPVQTTVPAESDERAGELAEFGERCTAKDGEACVQVAWAHGTGRDLPLDLVKAVDFYRRGCAAGDARGCLGLAVHQWRGEGNLSAEPKLARALQARACDLGSAYACRVVAEAHHTGVYAPIDPQQAELYLAKACEAGDAKACAPSEAIFEEDLQEVQREPIRAVIRDRFSDLRMCSQRAARYDHATRGRVVVDFEVGCDGYVRDIKVAENTFNDPQGEIETCVARMISGWEFDPPLGGAAVEFHYPFTFGP